MSRRRSSVARMTLEQSFHIAEPDELKSDVNTSNVAEIDETSVKSNLESKTGDTVVDVAEYNKRKKHVNRLWRERRDWKQIRKNVMKVMDDDDFVKTYCGGKVFCGIDVDKVYEQAEKEVKEFIENVLVEKYGENVRTLEDRHNYLVEQAKKQAVDLEREEMIQLANCQLRVMEMMKWRGDMIVEF